VKNFTIIISGSKKLFLLLTISLFGFSNLQAADIWKVDPSHSNVNFTVSHLLISEVDGNFEVFNGSIETTSDDFEDAVINFDIDVTSVDTDNEKRDGHLNSEDFFYTEKYPRIKFAGTSFKKVEGNTYVLEGNLTMRGVTKKVALDVKFGGILPDDGYGNTKAGFIVNGKVNRMDYGIAWNAKTEHGTWTLGEDVDITVKLQFVRQ
jgi:polyisoprenoid-binding protein YceI